MTADYRSVTRAPTVSGLVSLLALLGIACGGSDNPPLTPTATPTATATRTPTVAPSPTFTTTPLPSASGQEDLFGSTARGSGALTIDALALVPAYFSACLGGSGPNCSGGSVIYIGSDPGFKEADADVPTPPLFVLPDGITVSLEVIAIDPVVNLKFDSGTLSAPGQSLVLGTTPGIHADLEWQLLLPGGAGFDGHRVTLKLTTTASGYTDSAEFTVTVQPSSGVPPSES